MNNIVSTVALPSMSYTETLASATCKVPEICEAPNDLNDEEGFISAVVINGKKYKLRCEIVEVHPLTCTKCGGQLELHNGHGKCAFCGTNYSAIMSIVEE